MKYCFCLALVLLISGCGYAGRRPLDQTPPDPNTPVWVWTSGGSVEKWHDVILGPGWVSGVPVDMPLNCITCRRSIPLAHVDSMKVVHKAASQQAVGGVGVVAGLLAVEIAVCSVIALTTGTAKC